LQNNGGLVDTYALIVGSRKLNNITRARVNTNTTIDASTKDDTVDIPITDEDISSTSTSRSLFNTGNTTDNILYH
jgi:hypothetical protein